MNHKGNQTKSWIPELVKAAVYARSPDDKIPAAVEIDKKTHSKIYKKTDPKPTKYVTPSAESVAKPLQAKPFLPSDPSTFTAAEQKLFKKFSDENMKHEDARRHRSKM